MLSVGSRTILRWIDWGHFPQAYKMGPARNSGYRIPQSDVDAFLRKIKERQATPLQGSRNLALHFAKKNRAAPAINLGGPVKAIAP